MSPSLAKLIARIEDSDSADVSLKDVRVLARLRDPEVIPALVGLLDSNGRVGREAFRALKAFGRVAEPALRRCLGSHDETMRGHAEELLAALGETPVTEVPDLAALESGNDNVVEEVDLTPLYDAEIVRSIGGVLRARGVARQDVDDGVAEVQTRVLEALRLGEAPASLAEWRVLAKTVAKRLAVSLGRKRKVVRTYGGEPCEEPDAFVLWEERDYDPIDARRLFEVFKGMAEAGELPPLAVEVAEAKMGGLTDAEIGEELGLSEDAVERRRRVTRGRFAWKLGALGRGELVPRRHGTKKDGEATPSGDLPESLPQSTRG